MIWEVVFHNSSLEDELKELPPGLLAKFLRYAERLESFGPHLGMPHTRAPTGRRGANLRLHNDGCGRSQRDH